MPENPSSRNTLDARAYLQPLWQRRWLVVFVALAAAVAAYTASSSQAKQYVSATRIYIEVPDPVAALGSTGVVRDDRSLTDLATLMTSRQAAEAVRKRLGSDAGAQAANVSAAALTGSNFLEITAKGSDPAGAARLANTYAQNFLDGRRSDVREEAHRERVSAVSLLDRIPDTQDSAAVRQQTLANAQHLRVIEANPSAGARQIDQALAATTPVSPKPTRYAIFALFVGLVLGVILVYLLESLDRRLTRISALEDLFGGRPVLAALPHVMDTAPRDEGHPTIPIAFVEVMRSLRINLRLSGLTEHPHTILITSCLPREGKSTVARLLSLVYAEAGARVLVVDADLRRPSLDADLGVIGDRGLSHVLGGSEELEDCVLHVTSAEQLARAEPDTVLSKDSASGRLDLLTHGEPSENPVALFSSATMNSFLAQAAANYDVVILDSAPLLVVTDTVPLLDRVDGVVLVARLGRTTSDAADRLRDLLDRVPDANIVGVVANDIPDAFAEGYGSYGTYDYKLDGGSSARADVWRRSRRQRTPA